MTEPGHGERQDLMARALRELQRAQQRIDELEGRAQEPLSIVGAACRLPAGIGSPAELWQFLSRGGDGTGPMPPRWDVERFFDPRPGVPGRIAPRRGAFLDDVAGFDAAFFGIAPKEAEFMDPQQRLLLECCFHAFEDAGIAADSMRGAPVGVFVGISTTDYAYHLVQQVPPDAVTAHCGTGTTHAVAAGRIAYCFDLRGPCVALDTACSSSLVALHFAGQALRQRECDLALVAGVNVMVSPLTGASFSHARMLSPDGRCKTFAADADGYARGEGVVAVLLARTGDVARRGWRRRCDVLATAVNQDGRSAGLTVPNGPAQSAVIERALKSAGVDAAAIDVIEAHGTGTALGDPIELGALAAVFGRGRSAERPLHVASIKTNFGHTEAAAGVLSLQKAMLQLQHGAIAPHLHFTAPNPHVPWAEWPLRVPTSLVPQPGMRHAGVSSFGFSGTNAHAVLRAAPADAAEDAAEAVGGDAGAPTAVMALPLSAADPPALAALAAAWAERFAAADAPVRDLVFTAAVGRSALRVRTVVLGREARDFAAGLRDAAPSAVVGESLDRHLANTARSWIGGATVDFAAELRTAGARRIEAPLYPFQHRRFWYDGAAAAPRLWTEGTQDLPAGRAEALALAVEGALTPPLRQALQQLGARFCDGGTDAAHLFVAAEAATPEAVAANVQRLVELLQRAAAAGPPQRVLVLVSAASEQAPLALALRAVLRAVALEHHQLQLRWVAATPDAEPVAVARALLADDGEDEVLVRGGDRCSVLFQELPAPAASVLPLRADRSYLVTGGTGALGGAVARHLAASGAGPVWVLARHAAGELAIAADVADAAAMRAAVQQIERRGPPLAGVFHFAGVVDDALLGDVTPERLLRQFAPKLQGAWNLHAACEHAQLDHFVVASSAAAWLGSPGQVAYAAANGAVEGLCCWRRGRRLPALAIAFGPWAGAGMAASEAASRWLAARGVRRLDPAAALAAFAVALSTRMPVAAVVDVDWARAAAAHGGRLPPRFSLLAPRGVAAALPARAAAAALDAAAVARAVAAVLGLPPDAVAADARLADLGLDSLLAVDLRQRLATEYGVELPLSAMLAAVDCSSLAAAAVAARAPAALPVPSSGPEPDMVSFVENLSDAEVRAMLAREDGPAGAAVP